MLQHLRELDRAESVIRRLRSVRNLIRDPLPRRRELVFESYAITYPTLAFTYKAQGKPYVSSVDLGGIAEEDLATIDANTFQRIATTIGIMLAPFHFLLTDFAAVRMECGGAIDEAGRQFFERYLSAGLAEFRYRQGLDPTRRIVFTANHGTASAEPPSIIPTRNKILLLNGGGRDTAVMAELAKTTGLPLGWCSINGGERHQLLERASHISDSYPLRLRVDPAIRHDSRYKWGHTPFAAVYMAVSLLVAVARRFRYVAIGNEYSASIGNVRYRGVELNHQYSKSYEYETAFQTYLHTSVARGLSYFSLLRPFHDLGIAAMVSQMAPYLGAFVSCNWSTGTSWCANCPKCASTFLTLMPWNGPDALNRIFGANFIEKEGIRKYILDLTTGTVKPWECVGTREECRLALALTLKQHPELDFDAYPRRKDLVAACADVDVEAAVADLVGKAQTPHSIPRALWTPIASEAAKLTGTAVLAAVAGEVGPLGSQ
jgi:hypothetical protein